MRYGAESVVEAILRLMKKSPGRREFLQLLLLSGAAVGCRRVVPRADSTATPVAITATPPPVTLALDLRFELQNQAIDYAPHPEGCDRTTILGAVRDAGGGGLAGVTVHVWAEDGSVETMLTTAGDGTFSLDVADGLSETNYYLQLVDPSGVVLLSDVVIAQALPSCDLNLIQLTFVAGS
jgi:hypothetical protein